MRVIVRRNGTPTRGYGFKTSPTSIASLMGISLLCVSYTSLTHSRFHFTLVFFLFGAKIDSYCRYDSRLGGHFDSINGKKQVICPTSDFHRYCV